MDMIYVRLLDEGTDVWRPVNAEYIRSDIFKILPNPDYSSLDESWEFLPGTLVKCKMEVHDGKEIRVAYEQA
jgi:hypothetical protein